MAVNPVPMLSEGVVFASLSKKSKEEVIKEVGKQAAKIFEHQKDAIKGAFDFKKMVSDDRYDFYKGRSVQQWNELKVTFPEEYAKQIKDFYILERRISSSKTRTRVAGNIGDDEQYTPPNVSG